MGRKRGRQPAAAGGGAGPGERARREFVQRAVDRFGSETALADAFGVTRTAVYHWRTRALSVEAAVTIAEVLGIPYEEALRHATRSLEPRVRRAPPLPVSTPAASDKRAAAA